MATISSLPFIKGVSSPSRSLSVQVVAEQEAALLRQVEHWHQMYLDSDASLAQVKASESLLQKQLSSAIEREGVLSSKNMELRCQQANEAEEARKKAMLCEELGRTRLMLQRKEEELQGAQRQSATRAEELEKLREDLRKKLVDLEKQRAMEWEMGDLRKKLEASLKKITSQEHICEVMDRELKLLRSQLPVKEAELLKLKSDLKKKTIEAEQHDKAMQWELSDLQVRLGTSLQKTADSEEEVQQLQGQLKEKEVELEEMQSQKVEALELQMAELRGRLEAALRENSTKDHLVQLKEQELQKLKVELLKEHELCHAAVADNCELRQIYYEKLNALGQQEAKHQRSVEVLEAEKDMWLNRSGQLEKVNDRLRSDLQKNLQVAEAEMTLLPTPPKPTRPSSAGASFRQRASGRTLLQHRACEGKKQGTFDAEGREA
ncbi:Uncharacterized protein SCF082_LOCUS30268 [Durusdinium trenchii]|uniref:Uncharacterized protein n=1 Tax=Durusdinium trenchii TaxID=1381693 RepID=A0ABP0MXK7_9DINO